MSVSEIALTNGKVCVVDDADLPRLSQYQWRAVQRNHAWYAEAWIAGRTEYMHRFLLGLRPGDGNEVDHKDGDGLNNRRSNLRLATRQQNNYNRHNVARNNTTGVTGVHYYKRTGKYTAHITRNYVTHHLGYFDTIEEAMIARATAAIELTADERI